LVVEKFCDTFEWAEGSALEKGKIILGEKVTGERPVPYDYDNQKKNEKRNIQV
jgi:hypothetical protein